MEWSSQQSGALAAASRWMLEPSSQILRLFGYAGTGKTTLARHLVSGASRRWLFAAFTGKASHVLRQKGCGDARTIHSLIYRPNGESRASELRTVNERVDQMRRLIGDGPPTDEQRTELGRLLAFRAELTSENRPRFDRWMESPLTDPDVAGVIVDECSMVDERLGRDLESFGKKILVLGDPAQLPPVGAGGYFTEREPDIMLTEVHRHARESGILALATHVREGRSLASWSGGSYTDCEVWERGSRDEQERAMAALSADQVLVGRNATRRTVNVRLRTLNGRTEVGPIALDRVVCLRNDRGLGLFNGSQWIVRDAVTDADAVTTDMVLRSEDDDREVVVDSWLHHMIGRSDDLTSMGPERRDLQEFDWSYALTVHKAQGSQWREVVLLDESRSFGADAGRRWLYTGITRASGRLTVMA